MAIHDHPPVPLLFLIGDTGGGHRSAAAAVAQALEHTLPGMFTTVICDPLRGPDAARLVRWFTGLYGPCIRLTPWLWGLFFKWSGSPKVLVVLRHTLLAPAYDSVAQAIAAANPAAIVSFHPMTADPAVRARDLGATLAPVITVITDLITAHLSWRDALVDRVVVPSEQLALRCAADGMPAERYLPLGLPVSAEFCKPPLTADERAALKRQLGLPAGFLVVLTGGGEGSGGLHRRAAAILRRVEDVNVAVICGRNKPLYRRLTRLARRSGNGRLTAHGFVANMADWLRCADVVVGKAGPGTIAEATCCGAPLVLTSFVPGQEEGNASYVTAAGAGVYAPHPRQLAAEIGRLRRDPAALAVMREASARVGRPEAAGAIALLLAATARAEQPAGPGSAAWPGKDTLFPPGPRVRPARRGARLLAAARSGSLVLRR
jgi:1,2-diacylglycerol 3-beta-galactosyltransferase